jgi:hypothetical protein
MDIGAEPFFSFTGLEMAIKLTCLGRVRVLHPAHASAEPFFPPLGLPEPDPVIFDPFLQT